MRIVIQRVLQASVVVEGKTVAKIGRGIVSLVGIERGDTRGEAEKLIQKIVDLRIFPDEAGQMNFSLKDVQGDHLLISQFTLAGDTQKGRRPSFLKAEKPGVARLLFDEIVEISRSSGVSTQTGIFQADMKVELINDGPVTFVLETQSMQTPAGPH